MRQFDIPVKVDLPIDHLRYYEYRFRHKCFTYKIPSNLWITVGFVNSKGEFESYQIESEYVTVIRKEKLELI